MLALLLAAGDDEAGRDVAQAHLLAAQVERHGEHGLVGDGGTADGLAAGAGRLVSLQGGSTPSAAPKAAALTKAAAQRILASYWQLNNTANESPSDTLLKTVEAGSSYSMDAGTYQMDRVTDPANRQYAAFTAETAAYYIPRQPAGVYPRWFVARVTYANLAAPQHATGAGYVLFTQAARNAPWKNDLEPYRLTDVTPGCYPVSAR